MKYNFGNIVFLFVICLHSAAEAFSQCVPAITPDGYNVLCHPNGRVASEGMMRDGKPDGYWKTYHVTGIMSSEGNRVNFLLDSTWVFYTHTGDTSRIINYRLDKRSGYTYQFETITGRNQVSRQYLASRELFLDDRREGRSYYYYPSGQIRQVINFRNGRRQGEGREFDDNGTLITIFEFHNDQMIGREPVNRVNAQGEKIGTWKTFYPDGTLKEEEYYRNGVLHGVSRFFSESGMRINERVYREGQLIEEGIQMIVEPIELISYYEDGITMSRKGRYLDSIPIGDHIFFNREGISERFVRYSERRTGVRVLEGTVDENGVRNGIFEAFFETGELQSRVRWVNNVPVGEVTFFFREGGIEQTGNFNNGVRDGRWVWRYPSGNIHREYNLVMNVLNGLSIQYSDSATIVARGEYLDDEREGFWIEHVGDAREEGNYVMGQKDGVWKTYYKDGQLYHTGNFIQGFPDGLHLFYYPDGTRKEEQHYVMGRRHRNWRKYYENGSLFLTVTYNNDVEIRINGIRVDNIR